MTANTAQLTEPAIRLSDSEEEQCRLYARARSLASVAETLVPLAILIELTFSGSAAALLEYTRAPGLPLALGDFLFLVIVGAIVRLGLFPAQWVKEFWLDRQFGVSRQTFWQWLWEWLARSAVFGLSTIALLVPLVEYLRWWPLLAIPGCFLFLVGKSLFYDLLYYPLLNTFYPVSFLRHETFALPGIGKLTLPVYLVKVSHRTRRANAHIRLRGKSSAIYVTDTLIDEFTDGEERVVMAHEFGHLYDHLHLETNTRAGIAQAHRKLVYGSAQILAAIVSLATMQLVAPVIGLDGVHDLTGFPLLAALTLTLAQLFSPLLCAEARRDERDADEYALAITGDVENYVSVMRKLRQMNLEESTPSALSRFFFDTHPSYNERVHLAREYRHRYVQRKRPVHWRGWRHIQRHGRR